MPGRLRFRHPPHGERRFHRRRNAREGSGDREEVFDLMGYPHKPHPKETVVLSQYFGDSEARSHDGWVKRGGYQALKKVLGMTPVEVQELVKASGLRGRGGAGF